MNLYIPTSLGSALKSAADGFPLPVMLFLHGGDYSYGSADGGGSLDTFWYDGIVLGSYGEFIYASVNYRMHSFGFLSTDDENAAGNYGVDDVINAVQWVIDNADRIGADPARITLMGQSSGAALAHDVALTPQMKGKLLNVIPLSGSAVSYWGYWNVTQSVRNARELASGAHCNYPNNSEMVECLRQISAKELTVLRLHRNDTWRPTVEPIYYPATAEELTKENHDFNLFISATPDDGYEYVFTYADFYKDKEARFREHLRIQTVPFVDVYGKMPFLEEVFFHHFYPYDSLDKFDFNSVSDWQKVARYVDTDVSYENGVFKGAKLHTEAGGRAFHWGLDGPSQWAGTGDMPGWMRFVRSEDLNYIFGLGLIQRDEWENGNDCPSGCRATQTQIDYSEYVMHVLSNIVHSGNAQKPRPIPDYLPVVAESDWLPYSESEKVKNTIYIDSYYSQTISQTAAQWSDERLNNFYLFNDLMDDLEADRKANCEKNQDQKKHASFKTKKDRIFNFGLEKGKKAVCPGTPDPSLAYLSTTGGCLIGENKSNGQQFDKVKYANQKRFESSTLFSSSDVIDTRHDRSLCPNSATGSLDENCLDMSIYLPRSYDRAVIYLSATEEPAGNDILDFGFSHSTAIFIVNLRSGVFGYFHEGVFELKLNF